MARGYKNQNLHYGFILHISRPMREVLKRFSFVILLLLSIFMIFFVNIENKTFNTLRQNVINFLAPAMEIVILPIEFLRYSQDTIQTYFFVHSKNALLEKENKELRKKVSNLYFAKKENATLKKLLKYTKNIEYSYVTAKVIGSTGGPLAKSLIIDTGKADSVLNGQAAVVSEGLIGRVVESGENSARILLLSDINSKIPVIGLDSRERSIVAGNNTYNPKLIYLSKQSKIQNNEIIVTSGDGGLFPPGLMVGTAIKFPDGSYEVRPFVSWYNIEYVSILGIKKNE